MAANWEQYFERKTKKYDSDPAEWYEYKNKYVTNLPSNLQMPPTDTFYKLFSSCKQLKDISALANWDVSNIKNMQYMFSGCEQLQDITPLANWNVSKVENMSYMFSHCIRLQDITALANWDVSKVENMCGMFHAKTEINKYDTVCKYSKLKDITPLANWDVSNVKHMGDMFYGCDSLQDLSALANWDISNVKDIYSIVDECYLFSKPGGLWRSTSISIRKCKEELTQQFMHVIDELKSVIQQQQQTIDNLQAKINNPIALLWKP